MRRGWRFGSWTWLAVRVAVSKYHGLMEERDQNWLRPGGVIEEILNRGYDLAQDSG